MTWVNKGELTATFLYATPGAEGLRQAVKLLNGEKIPPVIVLPTMLVDKNNAGEISRRTAASKRRPDRAIRSDGSAYPLDAARFASR